MAFPYRYTPALGPRKASARQRALAQFRGIDLAPLEKSQALRARQINAFLPKVLSELRIDRRRTEAEVVKV